MTSSMGIFKPSGPSSSTSLFDAADPSRCGNLMLVAKPYSTVLIPAPLRRTLHWLRLSDLVVVKIAAVRSPQNPKTPHFATGALAGLKPGIANKGLVLFGRGGAI